MIPTLFRLTAFGQWYDALSQQLPGSRGTRGAGGHVERVSAALGAVAVDFIEQDDQFVLKAEVPGFDEDAIEVSLTPNAVELNASEATDVITQLSSVDETPGREDEDQSRSVSSPPRFVHRERFGRTVSRSISLPSAIDVDDATATYADGVLTLSLPKKRPTEVQQIDITES